MVKYRYTKAAFAGETHWGKQTAHAGIVKMAADNKLSLF
jgi:hypothetical protein